VVLRSDLNVPLLYGLASQNSFRINLNIEVIFSVLEYFYLKVNIKFTDKMCTRSTLPRTDEKCPHTSPSQISSTTSLEKKPEIGPYGPYNEPLLPPSKDMKNIVGDMMSMYGGVAAVLLQIAVCPTISTFSYHMLMNH